MKQCSLLFVVGVLILAAGSAHAWNENPNWVTPGWTLLAQGHVRSVTNFTRGAHDGSDEGFIVQLTDLIDGTCTEVTFHRGSPITDLADATTVKQAFVNAHIAGSEGLLVNVYGVASCKDAVSITNIYQ